MPRPPPSREVIDRVLAARDAGTRVGEIARREDVSTDTIHRWLRVYAPPEPDPDTIVRRLERLAADLDRVEDADVEAALVREAALLLDRREPPRSPSPALPPPVPDVELPDPADGVLPFLHALANLMSSEIKRSRALHDGKLAQHVATLQRLMPTIKQMEQATREGSDHYTIPKDRVAELERVWRERVANVVSRPLYCAECGKEIRRRNAVAAYHKAQGE